MSLSGGTDSGSGWEAVTLNGLRPGYLDPPM